MLFPTVIHLLLAACAWNLATSLPISDNWVLEATDDPRVQIIHQNIGNEAEHRRGNKIIFGKGNRAKNVAHHINITHRRSTEEGEGIT